MQLSIITDQINQDFETALQIIHEHGYKYIEIHNVFSKSIEECNDKEVKKIKELVQRYEVKVTNIASTIFFLCPLYENDQVTLFNPEFYSIKGNVHTHLRYLENACKIALELDCKRIRVFPFRWPDNRKPPFGTKEDMEIILNNLLLAEKIARNYGITLVLENCPYSHLPKGKMTLQLVQQINSPYLKLLWDPANSYRAFKQNVPLEYLGITLIEELKEVYPYIDHIHVKDYHGSHVLLKSEHADEEQIRMCANLAAFYSKSKDSSSVPVNYTTVLNLKKVPGAKTGFVTMKTYKTIYIDPQEAPVEQWIQEYKKI